jgi:hypothetical protein
MAFGVKNGTAGGKTQETPRHGELLSNFFAGKVLSIKKIERAELFPSGFYFEKRRIAHNRLTREKK